jgi:hypothetical protein
MRRAAKAAPLQSETKSGDERALLLETCSSASGEKPVRVACVGTNDEHQLQLVLREQGYD